MKFSVPFQLLALLLCCGIQAFAAAADSNDVPHFKIEGYIVRDTVVSPSLDGQPFLSEHAGTNAGVNELVRAATDLQADYARRGYPEVTVVIGEGEMANGSAIMHVVRSAVPQIVVFGKRYVASGNEVAEAVELPAATATNAAVSVFSGTPPKVLSPEQEALEKKLTELDVEARKANYRPLPPLTTQIVFAPETFAETNDVELMLLHKMDELQKETRRAQLLPPATNSAESASTNRRSFEVKGYEVTGNTLLSSNLLELVLQPYLGTNVSLEEIRSAVLDLQTVYTERGFATVSVRLPQQKLDDHIVKLRVFEGRLEEITVVNNRYFSSNNIMRALPSLHADMMLTRPIFEAELDRANANQDRQIYPAIEPGLVEGTSALKLTVKDRFPLHAKIELNNQNSPGTPDLRVNTSAEYKNFWQLEHSLGVQYSFSPEAYKAGDQWNFYDKPLVANYSTFYRLPLSSAVAMEDIITSSAPGNFGFDEATRRFNLPPPSGRLELNIFASRSTIDTGVTTLSDKTILDVPGVISIEEKDQQQDITVNEDVGMRLSVPRSTGSDFQSTLSGGLDYKLYELTSHKTNNFLFSIITRDPGGNLLPPVTSTVSSPNPPPNGLTVKHLEYLPVSLRYDSSWKNPWGTTVFGFGAARNLWHSGSLKDIKAITGSSDSKGEWLVLTPSLSHDFLLHTNWTLTLRADAQWASEPLISNEQFGAGGVNSVRGYHEGEVFGDDGWHTGMELKTPPYVVGGVYKKNFLSVRGSVFMDYAEVSLIDPLGRPPTTSLWGVGFGGVISVGPHWDGRFIFAWPLISTIDTPEGQPRFNFALTGQF